jgi:hypothetical protein
MGECRIRKAIWMAYEDAANAWSAEHDPEGLAFEYK